MKEKGQGKIELNEHFLKALEVMENTSRHVFITGRAGTGKSTLLEYFRANTKKRIAVLAPTGVAALNVRGQTIHSFFMFKPSVTPEAVKRTPKLGKNARELYRELDAIVIDEVSMVRADLLDCIDLFLRINGKKKKEPFGGVQMIFIGDLYQLPPVVKGKDREIFQDKYPSPYFFDALSFRELELEFVELEKIYRQRDERFIALLNTIRNNTVKDEHLALLNTRCKPDFHTDPDEFYVYLTPTNSMAEDINLRQLSAIKGEPVTLEGYLYGDLTEDSLPTESLLTLKEGAQVMLVNNDPAGQWVNGSIGRVIGFDYDGKEIKTIGVELSSGEVVEVNRYRWELYEYYYDKERKSVESRVTGSFTQFPLKLAWAVTIHKSQGKTFDRVVIDIGKGAFAPGQVYVALTRCTSLEGIVLKRPIEKKHIFVDRRIVKFITEFQYKLSQKTCPLEKKAMLIEEAIQRGKSLQIVYLKNTDEKSTRVITPEYIGEMEFNGRRFHGVSAICHERGEKRTFRLDRILEVREI